MASLSHTLFTSHQPGVAASLCKYLPLKKSLSLLIILLAHAEYMLTQAEEMLTQPSRETITSSAKADIVGQHFLFYTSVEPQQWCSHTLIYTSITEIL